jgi:hypothetical protein
MQKFCRSRSIIEHEVSTEEDDLLYEISQCIYHAMVSLSKHLPGSFIMDRASGAITCAPPLFIPTPRECSGCTLFAILCEAYMQFPVIKSSEVYILLYIYAVHAVEVLVKLSKALNLWRLPCGGLHANKSKSFVLSLCRAVTQQ